eukprot:TRINITY_DN8015_c0_g1_i2.p1 TRINITY_DN8015_c0_g1~~TRINITY_DN8015_c0_g1_i2.p1  ORF type:complete len:271 (+),score=78.32 TRINITY_DN8015_c0_g1_i2:58-870(+)
MPAELLVYVRLQCGETVPLELPPTATAGDAAAAVRATQPPAKHALRLAFQGRTLRDDEALADVGCSMEAVMHEVPAVVTDFVFEPTLCCSQLQVQEGGKRLRKLRDFSWAACTVHPPLEMGMEGVLHLKTESGMVTFGGVGLMEYTEAAGVRAKIKVVNHLELPNEHEAYCWRAGFAPRMRDVQDCKRMRRPKVGDIITLRASVQPGGEVLISDHHGATLRMPIQFKRKDGTPTQDAKYAFFVTLNNPGDDVEIVEESSGHEPFDAEPQL